MEPRLDPDDGILPDRVWKCIEQTPTCWLWTSSCTKKGYGKTTLDGKQVYVHRIVYEALVGEIPAGGQLDHACHVRNCVNPEHLSVVDNTANGRNRKGAQINSKSGIRGVHPFGDRWRVQVRANGRTHSGGVFPDREQAEAAAIAFREGLFTVQR